MLVVCDRGILGADLWRTLTATGAELLWRAKTNAVLPIDQTLADGSYLSRIHPARDRHRHADPTVVRVVEYRLDDGGRAQATDTCDTVYRLVTSILDPAAAPAVELAGLYAQRWEIETALVSSRPISADPARSCAPPPPMACCKRSGPICWSTTPFAA
jgi:hypothetical protein